MDVHGCVWISGVLCASVSLPSPPLDADLGKLIYQEWGYSSEREQARVGALEPIWRVRLHAAVAKLRQPCEDRGASHSQRCRNILRMSTGLDLFYCPDPNGFQGLVIQFLPIVITL